MNLKRFIVIPLLCIAFASCTKQQVKITSSDYYMESMNVCELSGGGENGSVFYCRLICNVLPKEGMSLLLSYQHEGGPVSDEYSLGVIPEYIVNDIIWMRNCIRFGSSSYVDYFFRIADEGGEYSDVHTLRVQKPFGAN